MQSTIGISRSRKVAWVPWCSHFSCNSSGYISWKERANSPESLMLHSSSIKRQALTNFWAFLLSYIYGDQEAAFSLVFFPDSHVTKILKTLDFWRFDYIAFYLDITCLESDYLSRRNSFFKILFYSFTTLIFLNFFLFYDIYNNYIIPAKSFL